MKCLIFGGGGDDDYDDDDDGLARRGGRSMLFHYVVSPDAHGLTSRADGAYNRLRYAPPPARLDTKPELQVVAC